MKAKISKVKIAKNLRPPPVTRLPTPSGGRMEKAHPFIRVGLFFYPDNTLGLFLAAGKRHGLSDFPKRGPS